MKKHIQDLKVIENQAINSQYYLLKLRASGTLPEILPGQFAEVKVDKAPNTFLRRPISVHDVVYDKNELHLLIEKKGEGTITMADLQEGESLNLVYPLGNTWSIPAKTESVLLVGGGCGVAPLLFTARKLAENGIKVTTLIGGRGTANLLRIDAYKPFGEVFTSTEDSSHGETGFVTQHSVMQNLQAFDAVLTCGPEAMMKALGKMAQEQKVHCEVSLENTMACGIGACLVCVQDTKEGHKCVCTDGPVFNVNDLKW
ncbi:MAG: dihydroorotate dehydrogenase electron transfer subunit [Bacteroidales bacterium]|nr:dihydroorotate dehydrogenase electron transfer subunit [Bacteroidales bacterium]